MESVIVTGANGFIGRALLQELTKFDIDIWAVVRNRNSNIEQIRNIPRVNIVYCDMEAIHDLPSIIQNTQIDTCIHLAWEGSFGAERANYDLQLRNVKYTADTISTMNKLGVKRFVGMGTLAEKDVMAYLPMDGSRPSTVSTYGVAKVAAHFLTKVQCTQANMEYIWCYLSNTYGVGNTTNNFVNMACKKMLNGERAAFTSGEQMYDFIYISDAARALALVAACGKANTDYFLGSTHPRPLKDYIITIRNTIDPDTPLYLGEIPFSGTQLMIEAYDTKKLVTDTGFVPEIPFEIGIAKTVDWLMKTR